MPHAEAAAHTGELHHAETFEEVLEGEILAERDEMDLVVAAGDAAIAVDDENTIVDAIADQHALRVPLLDEPRRSDEECCSRGQHIGDRRERVGLIGKKEGDRRLRPDHDVDAIETGRTAASGEIEIVGEDLRTVLRAPFLGLVDIGLDDAQANARAVRLRQV